MHKTCNFVRFFSICLRKFKNLLFQEFCDVLLFKIFDFNVRIAHRTSVLHLQISEMIENSFLRDKKLIFSTYSLKYVCIAGNSQLGHDVRSFLVIWYPVARQNGIFPRHCPHMSSISNKSCPQWGHGLILLETSRPSDDSDVFETDFRTKASIFRLIFGSILSLYSGFINIVA